MVNVFGNAVSAPRYAGKQRVGVVNKGFTKVGEE
jgi:hypothetical protein